MATVTGTISSYYAPTAASDWRTETVDLSSFLTSTSKSIKFRIRIKGNNGNNVYLDNFRFNATTSAEIDVTSSTSLEVLDEGFYDFGSTPIGSPVTETFTVSNTGNTNLILTPPITVTGTGFSMTTTFGTTTVAPGSSTTFQITFTPPSGGPFTGNLTFGTNDCDESPYNFELEGTGDVSPPVADFTASTLTVCSGSTVDFTDMSTSATSWSWNFGDATATPATSTQQNPTVVYNTPGTYTVTLIATNSYGSDTKTQTAYITVLDGTGGIALPITQGFTTATFLQQVGLSLILIVVQHGFVQLPLVILQTTGNSMMLIMLILTIPEIAIKLYCLEPTSQD